MILNWGCFCLPQGMFWLSWLEEGLLLTGRMLSIFLMHRTALHSKELSSISVGQSWEILASRNANIYLAHESAVWSRKNWIRGSPFCPMRRQARRPGWNHLKTLSLNMIWWWCWLWAETLDSQQACGHPTFLITVWLGSRQRETEKQKQREIDTHHTHTERNHIILWCLFDSGSSRNLVVSRGSKRDSRPRLLTGVQSSKSTCTDGNTVLSTFESYHLPHSNSERYTFKKLLL